MLPSTSGVGAVPLVMNAGSNHLASSVVSCLQPCRTTDFGSKGKLRGERAGGERAGTIDRMKKVGPNSTRYKNPSACAYTI